MTARCLSTGRGLNRNLSTFGRNCRATQSCRASACPRPSFSFEAEAMTSVMGRREFLGTTVALLAAAVGRSAEPEKAPVVDTHLHCLAGKDDKRFPYHEKAPSRPDDPATPEHLLKCMDGAGVDFAVVVHPEPYLDDHRYLEHCLEVGKKRLKGTCLFFADRPGSIDRMKE